MGNFAVLAIAAWVAVVLAGCSSNTTPLPSSKPIGSTGMSAKDTQKAIDELNKKRESHAQDAEQQIDQSR